MPFDACCKYCCLLQSTAFTFAALWDFWMQICGDRTIQFLTQQYIFANVLVSLEGLRFAPSQGQKRKSVLRAQSSGCGICTAPRPWSMRMPITWRCGGQPCHQLLLINMKDKSILFSREWPGSQNGQGVGKLPASVRSSLATGLQSMARASNAGSSTRCFYA